jgi:hypothetical protein
VGKRRDWLLHGPSRFGLRFWLGLEKDRIRLMSCQMFAKAGVCVKPGRRKQDTVILYPAGIFNVLMCKIHVAVPSQS